MKQFLLFLGGIIIGLLLYGVVLKPNKSTIKKPQDVIAIDTAKSSISQLQIEILNGNVNAYNLYSNYCLEEGQDKLLPWALIMANKFDNTQASFDVYFSLFWLSNSIMSESEKEGYSLENLDIITQKIAVSYLKKAAEKGHQQAKEVIEIYKNQKEYIVSGIDSI